MTQAATSPPPLPPARKAAMVLQLLLQQGGDLPLADLPEAVQQIISGYITEAKPAVSFVAERPSLYNLMMTPVVAAVLAAGVMWLRSRTGPAAADRRADVVGQLLLLSVVGIAASFSQVRLLVMTAAAVPLLAGYALAGLLDLYLRRRTGLAALGLIAASVTILAPFLLAAPFPSAPAGEGESAGNLDRDCRNRAALAGLDAIPQGRFLTPMNLGSFLLLATHHDALAGPYHRSPDAFANGLLPFQMDEGDMQAYLRRIGATHLVLCRGSRYGAGFATDLAAGAGAEWLLPVDVDAGDILVFEILTENDGPTG